MATDPHVLELIDEIMESGRSPEDVCSARPELLPIVLMHLQRVRRIAAEVDSYFPSSDDSSTATRPPPISEELPQIVGYKLQQFLGRGGTGIVYKAVHLRLNRTVALKMLSSGKYAHPFELERFHREAEAVAALQHPNIVQIFDVGDHDGTPYFTMEFLEGGTLAQKLAGTPQEGHRSAAMMVSIAEAIHAAHENGILHRDLKPSNILLAGDGAPKITDFGISRQLTDDAALTQGGVPLGTPSYMSPEQAQALPTDRAADVYSLGAILYEMLTGRPPFRAETATKTLIQVIAEDPVPPARLNPSVPRDLGTICLKCLKKEPDQRYRNAADLVADLKLFLENRPIRARPTNSLERVVRWAMRQPARASLIIGSTILVMLLAGVVVRSTIERAANNRLIEDALGQVERFERAGQWPMARISLEQASARAGSSTPSFMENRIQRAQNELSLASRLEAIRLNRSTLVHGHYDNAGADRDYQSAFKGAGFDLFGDRPESVIEQIKGSPIHDAFILAMDDWSARIIEPVRLSKLLRILRTSDPDPWRDQARNPATWGDKAVMAKLADSAPENAPVQLLIIVGQRLEQAGGDGVRLLKKVQHQHPADFWANLAVAQVVLDRSPGEAGGYYRAAIAARPEAAIAYYGMGEALMRGGWNEGIDYYRKAISLDPQYAAAYEALGEALVNTGDVDRAVSCFRTALKIDPQFLIARLHLGYALESEGRHEEATKTYVQAINDYRQADTSNPPDPVAQEALALALQAHGEEDLAVLPLQQALQNDPRNPELHQTLANVEMDRGQFDDAIQHYRDVLRFSKRLSTAHLDLGHALFAAGRIDEAIAEYQLALKTDPKNAACHELIGFAFFNTGSFSAATNEFKAADDLLAKSDPNKQVVGFFLGRCRRATELQELAPDALSGAKMPDAPEDRFVFADILRGQHRCRRAVEICLDLLNSKSIDAIDPLGFNRYDVACIAVQAGCGHDMDVAQMSTQEMADMRREGLLLLRSALEVFNKRATTDVQRRYMAGLMRGWFRDPDLAGVRNADALEKLPAAERDQWRTFWGDVRDSINTLGMVP